jgi:hypothetical protein
MRLRRKALAIGLAVVVLSGAAVPAAAQAGLTTFVAKRPGLQIRFKVRRHQIVFTELGVYVVCKGSGPKAGSVTLNQWGTFGSGIHRSGHIEKQEYEHFASGEFFWRVEGQVRRNRIVGRYTAWEERLDEEEWLPRCGTRSLRGLPVRFVAHRVSGPPWRG